MSYLEELFSLKGKVVVVTGGGKGIGQVVAIGMAKAGANVVILSRSEAEETVKAITSLGRKGSHIETDVTCEVSVNNALDKVLKEYGSIDIIFNNAGVCMHQSAFETKIEDFTSVINTNLTGQFIVARSAAKIMIEQKTKGSIINMASMSGSIVNIPQWQCSYNASKAAVIHMTKSLAMEWVEYGIRVNSISPGYIATPMSADTPNELKESWYPLIPMHRMGEPDELMPAILYLATNASGYTTGTDVLVDGGYTCL